jgi:Sulfatase
MRGIALLLLLCAVTAAALAAARQGEDDASRAEGDEPPPVVILVLDEFPADSLLGPDGQIDARRYPNFAALARSSTWFRNATTAYDSTFKAIPAILDGRMPKPGTAPDVRSHQPSIFHMLHRLGYDVIKVESGTAVCPPRICPGGRTRRPGVLARLASGARPARLHRWIGAIRKRPRPTFYFQHALLPHEPWLYLPSGHQARPKGKDPIGGINRPGGFHDRRLTDHNHLRYLLQVGYVDRELGLLMRRLRRTGLLDRALLMVLADHGYSFEIGVPGRRQVTESNIEEIAPVPFFVKAPGQSEGEVDTGLVRTIDVVATVADLLDTRVWWRQDGYSAFSDVTQARDIVAMPRRDFSRVVTIDAEELEERRAEQRRRRAAKFGTGAESEARYGDPWESAYRIGPNVELIGRRVGELRRAGASAVRAQVANAELLADVDPDAEILPTRVVGRLAGGSPPGGPLRDLAVAVNGRIRAVGRSFHLRGRQAEFFSLIVPESALRPGRNSLELFEVGPGGRLISLARI